MIKLWVFRKKQKNNNRFEMEDKSTSIGVNLTKTIVFFVLALAFVTGTFFLEHTYGRVVEEVPDVDDFPEGSVVRYDEEFGDFVFDIKKREESDFIFELEEGRFWGNFSTSSDNVNILVGNVVVIPNRATFDLSYDGGQFELAVYGGDVYLGFVEEDIELISFVDAYSDIFMNRILVPYNAQVRFNMRQITPEIRPLLYSKLMKDLRLTTISEARRNEEWVRSNIREDLMFVEEIRQNYLSDVVRGGVSVREIFWDDFLFGVAKRFTFIPERKEEMLFDRLFDYLDTAIFHSVERNFEGARRVLAEFESYRRELPSYIADGEDYWEKKISYMNDLYLFPPRDSLREIWRGLSNQVFDADINRVSVVDDYWLDIYRAINISEEEAFVAFDRYYSLFNRFIDLITDEDFYRMYLSYQNQLLDSLLLRTTVFYKDEYFEVKNELEQKLLELYPEGRLKEELEQLYISNKINLMRRLRALFFDEEVSAAEASSIFERLIFEAKDLMPEEDTGVAVVRLFESQLEDIIDFWGYLESPQYHVGAFGATHRERYEFYLTESELLRSAEDLVRVVLDEPVEEVALEEIKEEIKSVLMRSEEVYSIEIEEMETPDQRNVEISGVIAGYPFTAVYDRYQDSLRNVYVYGELVSERAIKMDGLAAMLESRFRDVAEEISDDEEFTVDTIAQRLARMNITDTFKNRGFLVDIEDVSIVDRFNLYYRVEEIVLEGYENIEVTFDFEITREESVTNLYMRVYGQPRVFEGYFSIEELIDMIKIEDELYLSPPPVETPSDNEEEDVGILR